MQSNTEKATVVLQYLFGSVDGERALRKVATRTHQCLAKSGKQPMFENNKLDLTSVPVTTKPLSVERGPQYELLLSRCRTGRASAPPPPPPSSPPRKKKAAAKSKAEKAAAAEGGETQESTEKTPADGDDAGKPAEGEEPAAAAEEKPSDGDAPKPAEGEEAAAEAAAAPVDGEVATAEEAAAAPAAAGEGDEAATAAAAAPATKKKSNPKEVVTELSEEEVAEQLTRLRRVYDAYLKLEAFSEPASSPAPEWHVDAEGRKRLKPPPPLWVRQPTAPAGLTRYGVALLMRDADVLDNQFGLEAVEPLFLAALDEPLQVDAEELPDVKVQFSLVHNGLELETRWRLTAAAQPTLEQLEHTLDFHRFCVLLERLATEAWPHLPPADAINHLLFEHVYPLCCGGDNGERPMRGAAMHVEAAVAAAATPPRMSDRRYFNGNTTGETRYCLQGHTYAQRRVNRKKEPVKFTAPDPSSYLRGGGGVKATTGSFSKAPGSSPSSKPPPPPPLQNVGTVVAPYVRVLQVVFAHYATLELEHEALCDWQRVRATNRQLSKPEFLKFLMNFDVTPYLLSRVDAEATVDQMTLELGTSYFNFPQFVELLLRCAVNVGDTLEHKIGSPATTVAELSALRKVAALAGPYCQQECADLELLRDMTIKARVRADRERAQRDEEAELYESSLIAQAKLQALWLQTAKSQHDPTSRRHFGALPWTKANF